MSSIDQVKLKAMAAELAKDIKTQADLANLSAMLLKMKVKAALGAEMEHNLGFRQDNNKQVVRKTMYVALGINMDGKRRVSWLMDV
jgi:transposase-like protein